MKAASMFLAAGLLAASAALPAAAADMGMSHEKVLGQHVMPATVDSVDHKTGVIDVTSAGFKLVVHFPPPTIAKLKKGDKILLHFGYSMVK